PAPPAGKRAACGYVQLATRVLDEPPLRMSNPMNPGPFAGILVIDLTRVLAGPFCTMMLAELGARVIKVENPDGVDDSRRFAPFFEGDRSAYFLSLNRGKESIALDLKNPADREVLLTLIRRADVLAENYRPGTMDRLGLGYGRLREE